MLQHRYRTHTALRFGLPDFEGDHNLRRLAYGARLASNIKNLLDHVVNTYLASARKNGRSFREELNEDLDPRRLGYKVL